MFPVPTPQKNQASPLSRSGWAFCYSYKRANILGTHMLRNRTLELVVILVAKFKLRDVVGH